MCSSRYSAHLYRHRHRKGGDLGSRDTEGWGSGSTSDSFGTDFSEEGEGDMDQFSDWSSDSFDRYARKTKSSLGKETFICQHLLAPAPMYI